MYYSFIKKDKSSLTFPFAHIKNHSFNDIDALECSKLVGHIGAVKIESLISQSNLMDWVLKLGYFIDNELPEQTLDFNDNLKYFPDNQEMLVIYNQSQQDITLTIFNSREVIKKINTFKTLDLYDDMWVKVTKPKHLKDYSKNIRQSINFDLKNQHLLRPMRNGDSYLQKLIPRHPFRTPCVHLPLNIEHKDLEIYHWQKELATPEHIIGIFGSCHDAECTIDVRLHPKQTLILDQIICQYKTQQLDQCLFFPCWYKTSVRKDFNYSF